MAYTYATFLQAKGALAARLDDASNVFWTDVELGLYIKEALRTWGSLTGYWRERGTFSTTAGTAFYVLPTQLSSLLGYTLKDQDLVTDIEYNLLEPPTPAAWTGTDQFTLADVSQALERRRDQFLMETGLVMTHSTQVVAPPLDGRVQLSEDIIDVRRAVWQPQLGPWKNLWREDEISLTYFDEHWSVNPGTPYAYSVLAPPPLTLQLAPPTLNAGTLDLVTLNKGAALDPAAGVVMGIPDDWCWVVKWGALADLLNRDGQARDPQRAEYCELRYETGAKIADESSVIVHSAIQGMPMTDSSLQDIDSAIQGWQGKAQGLPTEIALVSGNLIALCPVPDAVYSVTLDVFRKTPMPTVDGDFIQVGPEAYDAILDYAEHLAAFKMGGAEFEVSMGCLKRFLRLTGIQGERFRASAPYLDMLRERAGREEVRRPRRVEAEK